MPTRRLITKLVSIVDASSTHFDATEAGVPRKIDSRYVVDEVLGHSARNRGGLTADDVV